MTAVWAHRGASGDAPENTLPAFAAALRMGVAGIELDVHLTTDGKVVVIHDDTTRRTCGADGTVGDLTAAELIALDASNGMSGFADAHIPLLNEVLDLTQSTSVVVNVELKGRQPGLAAAVHQIVRDRGVADSVIYSSFDHYHLRALHDLGAASPLAALIDQPLFEPWDYAARLGAQALHPPHELLLRVPELVEQCHRHGVAVNVWTPDDPTSWERAHAHGVDAIITNHPAAAMSHTRLRRAPARLRVRPS